ncbi:MAG: prolipoprotein diacylglyceryl transferase [Dehalococcoidia bacterium]
MLGLLTIKIGINPNIGHIGGLTLAWHGVFIALGIAAGVYVAVLMARRKGFIDDDSYSIAFAAVVGGIIGARALFVAENWGQLNGNLWNAFRINEGGISVYGGIIGGTLGGWLYGMWKRLPIWKGLDAGAVGVILGQAIGRIGCNINGEHIGSPSHLPWAVVYANVNSPSFGLGPRQPAVGYELIGDVLILGVLLLLWRISKRDGVVFTTYALLYAVLRFGVSFFRLDNEPLLGLRLAQLLALGFIAVSLVSFAYLWRTAGRGQGSVDSKMLQPGRP